MLHVLERIEHPSDVVVGVLHEGGVHFHLALEHRLRACGSMASQAGISLWRGVSSASAPTRPSAFCLRERDLALLVPAVRELALVLLDPVLRHVMRRVRGARREVDEERLVRKQRLLLSRPGDELVGQVFGQVVALGRRLRRLDRCRALIERGIPLVVLAADEAVEVLEPAAAGRPRVERTRGARLPHRDFVALAELRGRVTIQLERERQRRLRVGQHRALARRSRGDLRDAAHADRVVVASGEQRLPRRRAQRRGVEARVLQPALGEFLEVRGLARTTEHAGGAVADVVDEDHQHVRRRPSAAARP